MGNSLKPSAAREMLATTAFESPIKELVFSLALFPIVETWLEEFTVTKIQTLKEALISFYPTPTPSLFHCAVCEKAFQLQETGINTKVMVRDLGLRLSKDELLKRLGWLSNYDVDLGSDNLILASAIPEKRAATAALRIIKELNPFESAEKLTTIQHGFLSYLEFNYSADCVLLSSVAEMQVIEGASRFFNLLMDGPENSRTPLYLPEFIYFDVTPSDLEHEIVAKLLQRLYQLRTADQQQQQAFLLLSSTYATLKRYDTQQLGFLMSQIREFISIEELAKFTAEMLRDYFTKRFKVSSTS